MDDFRKKDLEPRWVLNVTATRKCNTKKVEMVEEDMEEVDENHPGKKRFAGYRIRKVIREVRKEQPKK